MAATGRGGWPYRTPISLLRSGAGPCSGWGGPCVLDGASNAHVTLAIPTLCPLPPVGLLSVAVSGHGRVTMGNVAIDCGTFCTAAVRAYENVLLVAKPEPGATVLG